MPESFAWKKVKVLCRKCLHTTYLHKQEELPIAVNFARRGRNVVPVFTLTLQLHSPCKRHIGLLWHQTVYRGCSEGLQPLWGYYWHISM